MKTCAQKAADLEKVMIALRFEPSERSDKWEPCYTRTYERHWKDVEGTARVDVLEINVRLRNSYDYYCISTVRNGAPDQMRTTKQLGRVKEKINDILGYNGFRTRV